MSTVSHATLTGVDLHEPKGASTAASGTVYIANGAGSGSWGSVATSLNFVGMIADFALPSVPSGWLECDGTAVSRTTYSALWTTLTIQQSGTRSSGSPTITGLSDTSNMQVGYYVGGSGIGVGTTILSIGVNQITLSANASSSGTSTVIVSPFPQGDGSTSFNLPDTKTNGRYRRSRTSSVHAGTVQADQNKTHTHALTTASAASGGAHTHTITDSGHSHSSTSGAGLYNYGGTAQLQTTVSGGTVYNIGGVVANTTGISINSGGAHTHTLSGTTDSDGASEVRPLSLVVLTCIKY